MSSLACTVTRKPRLGIIPPRVMRDIQGGLKFIAKPRLTVAHKLPRNIAHAISIARIMNATMSSAYHLPAELLGGAMTAGFAAASAAEFTADFFAGVASGTGAALGLVCCG